MIQYITPIVFGFALMSMFLIAMAHAEDGRCGQLRSLKAQGAATSGQFTRAQVALATVWYRSNCGHKMRHIARRD